MYKWILGTLIGFSVLAAMLVVIYGIRPKAVPIIKPSNFVEAKDLGIFVNRQLYQRMREANTVVIGFDKANSYHNKLAHAIAENFPVSEGGKTPKEVIFVTIEESFSLSGASIQDELRSKNKDPQIYFTIFDLGDGPAAEELQNCELLDTYEKWLECKKAQKLRQISKVRKVDKEKTVALMETQSSKDIVIYISER